MSSGGDYETAIARTGWGLCHCFMLLLCGMCTLAEANASMIVLIVAPLLTCDLRLNRGQAVTLNATATFGMAAGALLFGRIADATGRKGSIPVSLVIVFCGSIALSCAQTNFLINLSIFMLGLGLSGSNIVLRIYLIECLPIKRRGTWLTLLDLLWVFGYLSALGISWSLIPSMVRTPTERFRLTSWRVLAGLGGAPSLVMACMASLLPPSPRYLLYRRRHDEAFAVLQQIYAINGSKHADTYPRTDLRNCIAPEEEEEVHHSSTLFNTINKFSMKTYRQVRELYRGPLKRVTLLGMLICTLQFPRFTWLALWRTDVIRKLEVRGNSTNLTGCTSDAEDMAFGFLHNCQEASADSFELLAVLSLSYVLGEALLFLGIDVVGRKIFFVCSGLLGAASSFVLVFAIHRATRIVLSALLLAAYAIGRTTVTIILLENYPTRFRGTAMGITGILPHLVSSFVILFLRVQCWYSVIAISAFLTSAALAGLFLPDLTGAPMRE